MKNHYFISHNCTEKSPANSFFPFGTYFKQSLSHGPSKRHTKVRSIYFHFFCCSCIKRPDPKRSLINSASYFFIVVCNFPFHTYKLNKYVKFDQGLINNRKGNNEK
ncbi:uncharacterized protein TOL2_C31070 [Desulfobacula toluolica Tol2]|uniref:Uncharacterized protein n=1 Tax=Desulfobacula toluolica (strain DSM 7467 / Tol2) TaxID=651182 RepID=K0NK86_DESTT|nr:uncharacterized protein TOL2_C31070 [Desulfobacula toluolica Tol2]